MKYLFSTYFFLLFLTGPVSGRDITDSIFHLKEIGENGLILNKGWKYKSGDNSEWSKPEFNDAGWLPIDPSEELHHLPEVRKSNIGWFRLRLDLDSSMLQKTVAFIVSGLGASEIYVNGQLAFSFGNVSNDFNKEQTRFYTNQLLSLKFGPESSQVIAIRHSFHRQNLYLKFTFTRPVTKIVLKEIDRAFADHIKDNNFDSTLRSIQVSFYLPLGFLLLFLFLSFRLQKEYFFFGIFCFCLFAAILLHIFSLTEPTTVSRSNYLLYATQIFYIIGALTFINGVYILYNRKKSWFYYFIILYAICSLVLYFISYDLSGLFNAFFFPLINVEFLRLSWQAVRRHRIGAGILFITSLLLNLSLLLYIWFTITNQTQAAAYLQSVSFIIPGIGLSLFFAGEFARTASSLRQRAVEVEKLSKEMIAKEREKQQILGAQNEMLEKQVAQRTAELSRSLQELKEAEEQLILREKMASLGELTAGIAHEIQNPLNFVNNFSEVNKELADELLQEAEKGNFAEVKAIAKDLKANEQKINHHGKRADAIVKNMLQHSRSTSDHKQPTDINSLAEEYLKLAYHGFRAKDSSFSATVKTDFDANIGKINIIPQDIGRVILNLINNAFYVVTEKKKQELNGYDPTITISTKKLQEKVEIKVADNGNGVSEKLLNKIFQPFFTTKPTGQGTGLGLSLSYDIVKAHGGEIKVETKEGEGTEFIVELNS